MVKNLGTLDRLVRALMAVAVAVLYATGQITGTAAAVLGTLAVVFLATSSVGICPLYTLFGLTTRKST